MTEKDFLLKKSIKESTIKAYQSAMFEYMEWLDETGYVIRTAEDLNDLLTVSEFTHECYETSPSRDQRVECGYAMAGFELWFSSCKRHLIESHRDLKSWDNLVPPSKRVPIAWEWTYSISYALFLQSRYAMVVAILLVFECCLRHEDFCGHLKSEVVLRGENETHQLWGGTTVYWFSPNAKETRPECYHSIKSSLETLGEDEAGSKGSYSFHLQFQHLEP